MKKALKNLSVKVCICVLMAGFANGTMRGIDPPGGSPTRTISSMRGIDPPGGSAS